MRSYSDDDTLGVTDLQRIDAICEQFELSWQQGAPATIESFLDDAPPQLHAALFADLLRVEVEYRSKSGRFPHPDEYHERFPQYTKVVETTLHDTLKLSSASSAPDVAPPANLDFQIGARIDEFEIRDVLGQGAFGKVYRAWQHGVDRDVALKVSVQDPSPRESSEPQTLARLDGHPGIVRIFDQRHLPDRGLTLIYMEYVRGETLRALIRGRQADPDADPQDWVDRVCRIGRQLADALDFAHQNTVLHCDVKPANVLLDGLGRPKLVDFNIAHRKDLPGGQVGGTFPYMSPEQIDAYRELNPTVRALKISQMDGRSDVYSLGIVLWELLTGRRPFDALPGADDSASSLTQLADQRRLGVSTAAMQALPDWVPEGLRRVLSRCLAADPHQRYSRAGDLAHDLHCCGQAEIQPMLYPARNSWRYWVALHPLLLMIVMGMATNGLVIGMCVWSNSKVLDEVLPKELLGVDVSEAYRVKFRRLIAPIDGIAFTLGMLLSIRLSWPVTSACRRVCLGLPIEADSGVVDQCVRLGPRKALLSLCVWTISSLVWATAMVRLIGELNSQVPGYSTAVQNSGVKTLYFAGLVLVCGVIATSLIFFANSFVCLRVILPHLLRDCRKTLPTRLETPLRVYLGLLLVSPFVVLMAFMLSIQNFEGSRLLMVCLCGLGLLGSGVAVWCTQAIRSDFGLLSRLERTRDRGVSL